MYLPSQFRKRLTQSDLPLFGAFSVIADPAVVELIGIAGFDFVGIEMEHGAFSIRALENHHRAAAACGLGAIVKLPADDDHLLLKVLETGVDGVLLAGAHDVEAVIRSVSACRHPPIGTRGVSTIVRGAGYGSRGMSAEALDERSRDLVVAVLIEAPSLAAQIDQLVAVPGIDFLFIGTADLALAMRAGGESSDVALGATINRIVDSCRSAGVAFGLPMEHPAYPKGAAELRALGCRVVIATSDVAAMLNGLRGVMDRIRG